MEAILVCINGWMDEQNVVYPYSGTVVNLKNEGNPVIYCKMHEP